MTMTTNAYSRGVRNRGWQPFPGRLWQRNYYERIVRSRRSLEGVRDYIEDSPGLWDVDAENPKAGAVNTEVYHHLVLRG